jgi:hypothetical protein
MTPRGDFVGAGGYARLRRHFVQRVSTRVSVDRWNFGLCATIPREPRQARKGATVTGQFRVPRSTRSSSSRVAQPPDFCYSLSHHTTKKILVTFDRVAMMCLFWSE